MRLANKILLLTGASQGIGKAAAGKFIEAGCRVVLVARSHNRLAQLANELGSNRTLVIPIDIGQPEAGSYIVEQTLNHFGRVDILVNNAALGVYGPSATVPRPAVEQILAVNFIGPLRLMQACIPPMQAQGGGLIINISSIIGRRSTPMSGPYCASKAALEHLVESFRVELAPHNIRFSTLYPGVTRTNFAQNSLGTPERRQGRVRGVSAEKVAAKLVQVAKREPRDAYVTFFDWAFITGSRLFPSLVDRLFRRYFKVQ